MSDQDPIVTQAIIEALGAVASLVDRHKALNLASMPPDSTAATDAAVSLELGHEPWDLVMDQLAGSLDHLIAWRELITAGTQPAFAHLTLVRGSMESTVTARWLLDPSASPMERVSRAVSLMTYDYEERRLAEKALGITRVDPPAKLASVRKAELERDRLADHIPSIQRLGATKLFSAYAEPATDNGEAVYRILSAYAHGRRWRLLMGTQTPVAPARNAGEVMSVEANDRLVVDMTTASIRWVDRAMGEAEEYIS